MYFLIWIMLGLLYFIANLIIMIVAVSDYELTRKERIITVILTFFFGVPMLILLMFYTVGYVIFAERKEKKNDS